MSDKITVSVLNRSDKSIVTDHELERFVRHGLQEQVSGNFAPHWKIDAEVKFAEKPHRDSWWLVILNTTDQRDWLGYHLTDSGLPLAKVFAKSVKDADSAWTVSVSHELLEMLADPYCNRMVCDPSFDPQHLPRPGDKQAVFYALEVCDPCSADENGYKIASDSYTVSDFVLPSWFESETDRQQFVDYNRKIQGPFNLATGGYCGVYSMDRHAEFSEDGWQLKQRRISAYRQQLMAYGRTTQRTMSRSKWKGVPRGLI